MDRQSRFTGYDGSKYRIGDRVELHPGTDLWMQGARYGEVIGSSMTPNDRVKVKLDKLPNRKFSCSEDTLRAIPTNPLLERLRHHVTGAIERGESGAIVEQRAPESLDEFSQALEGGSR